MPLTGLGTYSLAILAGREFTQQSQPIMLVRIASKPLSWKFFRRIQRLDPIKRIRWQPNTPVVIANIFNRVNEMLLVEDVPGEFAGSL